MTAGYDQCQGKLLRLLERLVYLREVTADYTYYGIASPWLQVWTLTLPIQLIGCSASLAAVMMPQVVQTTSAAAGVCLIGCYRLQHMHLP